MRGKRGPVYGALFAHSLKRWKRLLINSFTCRNVASMIFTGKQLLFYRKREYQSVSGSVTN